MNKHELIVHASCTFVLYIGTQAAIKAVFDRSSFGDLWNTAYESLWAMGLLTWVIYVNLPA